MAHQTKTQKNFLKFFFQFTLDVSLGSWIPL